MRQRVRLPNDLPVAWPANAYVSNRKLMAGKWQFEATVVANAGSNALSVGVFESPYFNLSGVCYLLSLYVVEPVLFVCCMQLIFIIFDMFVVCMCSICI